MAPEKIARIVQVTFNVKSDAYDTFIDEKVRVELAGPKPDTVKGPKSKEGRPVLRKEMSPDKQPEWWIHVVLKGENGEAPKVAIRNDNVYIIGFTNSQGTWYQLSKTKTFPKLVDDNAVWAGFDGHYQTLVGGVDNLKTLKVNKKEVADAAAKLWNYKPTKLGDDDDETALLRDDQYKLIKTAVATLCVAVCEAARFIAVSSAVASDWDKYRAPITEQMVKYIKNWADCSKALLQWKSSGYKDDTPFKDLMPIGIKNGDVALGVVALVKLIIRSSMAAAAGYADAPTDEELLAYAELPKHGRYMAEVFAVRIPAAAGGDPPSGTISFHGGHCCSDVIYSWTPQEEHWSQQACDSQGNIVLTGPSVATSADSPVAFSLDLHDGNGDGKTGSIVCDSIGGDFSNYNRAIAETVQTGYGPAEVTYAVLSNGVQGRVAVKLARLPASKAGDEEDAGVLGRITALSKLFDVGCVLFYNEADKGVCVGSGGLVPLARDALAVPLHMPLTFELDLHGCSGDEIVRGAIEFSPAIDGQHTERLVGENGAELEVTVSWSEYPW